MEEQSVNGAVYIHKLKPVCEPPSSEDMARSAYELLRAVAPPLKKRVAIKPNITVPAERDSGIVTHPDFVAGVIDYFREMGVAVEESKNRESAGAVDALRGFL